MQKKIGKILIIFKSELEILFKSTGKIKHHGVSAWQRDTVLGDWLWSLGYSSEVGSWPTLHEAWKGRREGGNEEQQFPRLPGSYRQPRELCRFTYSPKHATRLRWGPHQPTRKELLPAFGRQGNRHMEPSFSYQAGFAARSPHLDTLNHHAMGSVSYTMPKPGQPRSVQILNEFKTTVKTQPRHVPMAHFTLRDAPSNGWQDAKLKNVRNAGPTAKANPLCSLNKMPA